MGWSARWQARLRCGNILRAPGRLFSECEPYLLIPENASCMTTKPITIPSMMEIETFGESPQTFGETRFLFLRDAKCGMLKSRGVRVRALRRANSSRLRQQAGRSQRGELHGLRWTIGRAGWVLTSIWPFMLRFGGAWETRPRQDYRGYQACWYTP